MEQPVKFRDPTDINTLRTDIFDKFISEVGKKYAPGQIQNERIGIELDNLRYQMPKKPMSLAQEKKAILNRANYDVPLKGRYRIIDRQTGNVISEADKTVTRVPLLTKRGTFILKGNEYSVINQQRLRPSIYTRIKQNGELESHANLIPGTGRSFRVFLEPRTGVFRVKAGQGSVPLYTLMNALGSNDDDISESMGKDLMILNRDYHNKKAEKYYKDAAQKFGNARLRREYEDNDKAIIRAAFEKMEIDPEVTSRTLGINQNRIDKFALAATAKKLLAVSKNPDLRDDRDSQANQIIWGPEDIFAERIAKDAGGFGRNLLWKMTYDPDANKIPSSYFNKQTQSAIYTSGMGSAIQEINPVDILDQHIRVTRLGEGGIPSDDAIPVEARDVSPSQLGLIDIIRGPESARLGVDTRLAVGVMKGSDNKLYRHVLDAKGKKKIVDATTLSTSTVAFPGQMQKYAEGKTTKIQALSNGEFVYVDPAEVDYQLPTGNDMFGLTSNMVPTISAMKGGRLLMAGKMFSQALSLRNREAPLVQAATPEDENVSYEDVIGEKLGAVRAKKNARVVKVTDDDITLRYADGTKEVVDIYNNFPLNQKSYYHNTPTVKVGDEVKAGDLIATSNYTDSSGTSALGVNLRVAYMPFQGNFEDAIVVSESAAKKLASEHMYQIKEPLDEENTFVDKKEFLGKFPGQFNKTQLETIDDEGVVKPGTRVQKGDPLILRYKRKKPSKDSAILKQTKSYNIQDAQTWDSDFEGLVTDTTRTRSGIKVTVKSFKEAQEADKISARQGNKGVIKVILPDDQMPKNVRTGEAYEMVYNPLGLISRVNPSQMLEVPLAKLARKTGKTYKLPAFVDNSYIDFVQKELQKHGLSDTEAVYDPSTNRELKDIFGGEIFVMKLHHDAASKAAARDVGRYSMDATPAKGGPDGAKRVGNLDVNAFIAHGATEILKDAKLIRGQKNDEFWTRFRTGQPFKMPKTPFVYEKYQNYLRAGGVNVDRTDDSLNISAMTDKSIDELTKGRKLTTGDAINLKTKEPVKGGLFDIGVTGGRDGNNWTAIELPYPMPQPIMEEPIRRMLGLTTKQFEDMLGTKGGSEKIKNLLSKIDVDKAIKQASEDVKQYKGPKRDNAVKQLRYLTGAKAAGIHPSEWMVSKVPVLPPRFRPVAFMKGMELTSDPNLLYKDLFEAQQDLRDLENENIADPSDRLAMYNAMKAVVGLGDPVNAKSKEKNVQGVLKHVFGKSSSKFGMFQNKLISMPQDSVGRATVTPDNTLDMDQIGMPEDLAWRLYKPFIMRRLARRYNTAGKTSVSMQQIADWIVNKDPKAWDALHEELKERPVIYTRAPGLHKFNAIAGMPVLRKGKTLRVSPVNVGGMNMDFDGDTSSFHVPVSPDAVREAKEKILPSKMLYGEDNFDVRLTPSQEYLMGLYFAGQKPNKKKATRKFASEKDVIQAYKRGEIDLNDPVEIV